jgi:DNA-directed RNA polymerase subunit omega
MAEKKEETLTNTNGIDSKYRKILIAAKRSKQIQKGAQPRVNMPDHKPTRVALEEVERGLINFEIVDKSEK